MLKLTGRNGKSLIVDAIQKRYKDSRVYSYNNYMVPTIESYHVDVDECQVEEFCELIYDDISKLENEAVPISIVVIYTNLKDIEAIEELANKLEMEQLVRMVVVTGK